MGVYLNKSLVEYILVPSTGGGQVTIIVRLSRGKAASDKRQNAGGWVGVGLKCVPHQRGLRSPGRLCNSSGAGVAEKGPKRSRLRCHGKMVEGEERTAKTKNHCSHSRVRVKEVAVVWGQ